MVRHSICRTVFPALLIVAGGCETQPQAGHAPPSTQPTSPVAKAPAPSRSFVVSYVARLPAAPAGGRRLDLWLPLPSSDAQQTIDRLTIESSLPHELETEPLHGNRVAHFWSDQAGPATATVSFYCTRRQERALPISEADCVSQGPAPDGRYLHPDRLGVIDKKVRALAAEITAGQPDTLSKARAIYAYVLAHMAYDKTVPGWGNGDTRRACDVGKGNCTDFHALFISLARASGIPARFGIGFQLPAGQSSGQIAGYHCWAEFWLPGTGWVPVDASEAWKDPSRRAFYFGSLDENRIRLSVGRDLVLPGMKGAALNYFLSPYAEVDGTAVPATRSVTFTQERTAVARSEHSQPPGSRTSAN